MGCKSGKQANPFSFMTTFEANGVLLSDITSGQQIPICSEIIIAPFLEVEDTQSFNIDLKWSTPYPTDFQIERSLDGVGFTLINTVGNVREYSDSTVDQGITYYYRIRPVVGSLTYEYSNIVSTQTPLDILAPSDLIATGLVGTVQLDWTSNSAGVEDGFSIERSDDGGLFVEIATVGAGVVTYNDNLPPAETDLTYRVTAIKNELSTAYSNTDTVNIVYLFRTLDDFALDDHSIGDAVGVFDTEWDTSSINSIALPLTGLGSYDFDLYLNGTYVRTVTDYTDNLVDVTGINYSYVRILGKCEQWNLGEQDTNQDDIRKITNWGDVDFKDVSIPTGFGIFELCGNLESVESSTPLTMANTTNTDYWFADTTSLTGEVKLDMSNVTSAIYMFSSSGIDSFDNNTPNLVTANFMFDSSSITSFNSDIPNCVNANQMFANTTGLKSLGKIDVSSIQNANYMFLNSGLETFEVLELSSIQNGLDMFRGAPLQTESWSNQLIYWADETAITNVNLGIVDAYHNSAGATAINTLVNSRGWTITDLGLE